ncbi:hypothetical protein T01_7073 [Trichinella spiralis]|uniref:Uncharacterized protein n=1 Tax=Trichinella spiralis TaxID=6334 RepID=A0A0V1BP33_TRISP|nr:hypothetical protein T01_7073 [Trichinella spiralis]
MDRISLSQYPPIHGALSVMNFHCILWANSSFSRQSVIFLSNSSCNSWSNCLKERKLSDCRIRGLPRQAINRRIASITLTTVMSDTTSKCTARVVMLLFFTVFPLRVSRGPAKSRPVFSIGRVVESDLLVAVPFSRQMVSSRHVYSKGIF